MMIIMVCLVVRLCWETWTWSDNVSLRRKMLSSNMII